MPSGPTTTGSLADSQETIIADARMRRQDGVIMTRVVDNITLKKNTGLSYNEIVTEDLVAQDIDENTVLDNFQQYVDAILTITPTIIGLATFVTDRARNRLSTETLGQMGRQPQNAIEERKDKDGLAILDTLSGRSIAGAGTTLTQGHIRAHQAQNKVGSGSEPWTGPQVGVLHSYQVKDLEDELLQGIDTYPTPKGITEDVFREGWSGKLAQVGIFTDDNITIDSVTTDAKGGVFARGKGGAIILVQGHEPRMATERDEFRGGGGEKFVMYDEYKFGLRQTSWGGEVESDATAPTS